MNVHVDSQTYIVETVVSFCFLFPLPVIIVAAHQLL